MENPNAAMMKNLSMVHNSWAAQNLAEAQALEEQNQAPLRLDDQKTLLGKRDYSKTINFKDITT